MLQEAILALHPPMRVLIFEQGTKPRNLNIGRHKIQRRAGASCGTTLGCLRRFLTVISMRPAAFPPMEMSKNTTGRDMVAVEGGCGRKKGYDGGEGFA